MTSRSAEETILAQRLPHLLVLDAEILDAFSGKTAHVLTSAVCGFECFAKCSPSLIDKNLACVEHACQGGKAMNHTWPASVIHSDICGL